MKSKKIKSWHLVTVGTWRLWISNASYYRWAFYEDGERFFSIGPIRLAKVLS